MKVEIAITRVAQIPTYIQLKFVEWRAGLPDGIFSNKKS
jgi:hypothetical protein